MARIIGVISALVVTLAALWWVFAPSLALMVTERAIARNLAADPVNDLGDGLHVALCGAGGPMASQNRSGPCVAVVAGGKLMIFDAGASTVRNLTFMQLPPAAVSAVFLTHFHSDHIDGLGELMLQRWAGGAHREQLPVYGPPGVQQVIGGLNAAYRLDASYRVAHHGPIATPPGGAGGNALPFEAPAPGTDRVVYEADGVRVEAFNVSHHPVHPSVGYRVSYKGRTAVISGDTIKSDEVIRAARDVDVLVHEALSTKLVGLIRNAAKKAGRDNIAKIMLDIPDYHTTPQEAAEVAQAANAGFLLFYHVVPALPLPGLERVFLEGVGEAFDGRYKLGRDGIMISLPPQSDTIKVSNRMR